MKKLYDTFRRRTPEFVTVALICHNFGAPSTILITFLLCLLLWFSNRHECLLDMQIMWPVSFHSLRSTSVVQLQMPFLWSRLIWQPHLSLLTRQPLWSPTFQGLGKSKRWWRTIRSHYRHQCYSHSICAPCGIGCLDLVWTLLVNSAPSAVVPSPLCHRTPRQKADHTTFRCVLPFPVWWCIFTPKRMSSAGVFHMHWGLPSVLLCVAFISGKFTERHGNHSFFRRCTGTPIIHVSTLCHYCSFLVSVFLYWKYVKYHSL